MRARRLTLWTIGLNQLGRIAIDSGIILSTLESWETFG